MLTTLLSGTVYRSRARTLSQTYVPSLQSQPIMKTWKAMQQKI